MDGLSNVSLEERKRIARTARRDPHSERILILTAGFALTMMVLFFFGTHTFLPLAAVLGVRPLIVWVVLSFVVAAVCAALHSKLVVPKIADARRLNAAFLYKSDGTPSED